MGEHARVEARTGVQAALQLSIRGVSYPTAGAGDIEPPVKINVGAHAPESDAHVGIARGMSDGTTDPPTGASAARPL